MRWSVAIEGPECAGPGRVLLSCFVLENEEFVRPDPAGDGGRLVQHKLG